MNGEGPLLYDRLCLDGEDARKLEPILDAHHVPYCLFPPECDDIESHRYLLVGDDSDHARCAGRWNMDRMTVASFLASRPPLTCWVDAAASRNLFVFDIGGVVVSGVEVLPQIATALALPYQSLLADYRGHVVPLMEGILSPRTYWRHVETVFGVHVVGDPFCDWFAPVVNREMVAVIRSLRSIGRRVVCGSNTIACHWKHLEAMGVLDLFDCGYASHEMGVAKPDSRFLEVILEREGQEPSATYFVDDLEANVRSAADSGIACLLYADGPDRSASEKLEEAFAFNDPNVRPGTGSASVR